MTAYDAAFVALSESLPAPLLTCDAKLAATSGHRAAIDLISKSV
jgi:predicted nucleic acid-binding protein